MCFSDLAELASISSRRQYDEQVVPQQLNRELVVPTHVPDLQHYCKAINVRGMERFPFRPTVRRASGYGIRAARLPPKLHLTA